MTDYHQPPFDLGITNQLVPQRQPASPLHRLVRGLVVGLVLYLIIRRFGHHKLVRLAYAAPMGYGLALLVSLVMMFSMYVLETPVLGSNPSFLAQGLADALPSLLLFFYLGTRWTLKFYRSLTRQYT